MHKQDFYQTRRDTVQDIMRFAAICLDSELQPADVLRMLDKYMASTLDSIDSSLNEMYNVQQSQSI